MSDIQVTYDRLDRALRSLGFSVQVVTLEVKARVYKHEPSGALVVLPISPDDEEVLPRHLVAVRTILDEFGIADPTKFIRELSKAG